MRRGDKELKISEKQRLQIAFYTASGQGTKDWGQTIYTVRSTKKTKVQAWCAWRDFVEGGIFRQEDESSIPHPTPFKTISNSQLLYPLHRFHSNLHKRLCYCEVCRPTKCSEAHVQLSLARQRQISAKYWNHS